MINHCFDETLRDKLNGFAHADHRMPDYHISMVKEALDIYGGKYPGDDGVNLWRYFHLETEQLWEEAR